MQELRKELGRNRNHMRAGFVCVKDISGLPDTTDDDLGAQVVLIQQNPCPADHVLAIQTRIDASSVKQANIPSHGFSRGEGLKPMHASGAVNCDSRIGEYSNHTQPIVAVQRLDGNFDSCAGVVLTEV